MTAFDGRGGGMVLQLHVDSRLLNVLAQNLPRPRARAMANSAAREAGVPVSLVLGIYAIETYFRPFWLRWLENVYLALGILFGLVTGKSFRNLTIGPFQIGCHVGARFLGLKCAWSGAAIRPLHAQALNLIKLCFYPVNLEVAVHHVARLWREAETLQLPRALSVWYVGWRYNGRAYYGDVLRQLVPLMEQLPSRADARRP